LNNTEKYLSIVLQSTALQNSLSDRKQTLQTKAKRNTLKNNIYTWKKEKSKLKSTLVSGLKEKELGRGE